MMELFEQLELARVIDDLRKYESACNEQTKKANDGVTATINNEAAREFALAAVEDAERLCERAGWVEVSSQIGTIARHLKHGDKRLINHSSLSADLRNARDLLLGNLAKRKFVQIRPQYAAYVNNDKPFGEAVYECFSECAL